MKKLVLFCVFVSGFAEYMVSGGELAYQQLCSEITQEFNDCSKQVRPLIRILSNIVLINSIVTIGDGLSELCTSLLETSGSIS